MILYDSYDLLRLHNTASGRYPEKVEFDAADVLGGIKHIEGEEHLIRVSYQIFLGQYRVNKLELSSTKLRKLVGR